MNQSAAVKKPIRILLVEDEEADFALLKYYLEQADAAGYVVAWAKDLEQAARKFEKEEFAVCLVDYGPGPRDGLEFLKRFANIQQAPPMILITGSTSKEIHRKARGYGAADCLIKHDLSPQLLSRVINHVVTQQDYYRKLWLSREHYRKIFDSALNAITVIDQGGTVIGWNPQAERLFGWRREEVIGRNLEETIVLERRIPFFRAWLADAAQTVQPEGTTIAVERTLRHKDGHEIPVLGNITRMTDGGRMAFVAFYQDLTVAKLETEKARRYEAIVQSTVDVMALLDRHYAYVAANDAHGRIWGKKPADLIGHHVKEVLGDEVFEQRRPIYDRVLAGESLTDNTWVNVPKLGQRYWSVHYDPYRDGDGNVIGIVVDARDITEQKRAEEALTKSNELINAVMHLQAQYIMDIAPITLFQELLDQIITLTQSEFGFIGEIFMDEKGAPLLKTYALTDISWNEKTRAFYNRMKNENMEFHDLKTLFGAVITSHEPVISNDPGNDPRAGGPLPGHPPLKSFLGLPFNHGSEILGMVGIANRPGGYDEAIIRQLEAITSASAGIISHWRSERRLASAEQRFQHLYDENPAMFFSLDPDGIIVSTNRYAADQLGYDLADLIGHPVDRILHPDDVEIARNALREVFASPDSVRSWELRKIGKSGESFWVRETARITTAPGGGRTALIVCEDISGAKALSEQLSYQATHDALTDLINRREFERRLGEAINSARFHGAEHAMCFIDLDQFKVINDTCGHMAGDALLRDLAGIIGRKIRRRDTLARLGGDEFALLMEHCSLAQARQIAANLHNVISDYQFNWQDRRYRLGSSMGVVPVSAISGDVHEVLRLADAACYAAKDAGRDTIHVYDVGDELLERRHGEMLWVERINRSLEQGLFRLAHQPIIRTRGPKRGQHYEILTRLLGDDGVLILPGAFLPAAERYGVIGRIDRWVVATWFNWLREHPPVLQRLTLSSINLSAHSIGDKAMLDFIQAEAGAHAIPPEKICFELTETAAIANLSGAVEFMNALSEKGFRFALDDFGSGLSSFAYLRSLPVNYVKIDGVFVREIADNRIDRAMVQSINDVTHTMGKMTIAEFVEDESILAVLGEIGVDYAQGYGIGRPESIDTLLG
ncbi:MAG: PAS domain S-box protein [Gammaproteobacteria bacterium]|nr:PAS domain S-box protein [Gammaproteobacteria bacterium]